MGRRFDATEIGIVVSSGETESGLRGRNLTRDIQTSGAPMGHLTPDCECRQGSLSFHPLDTGAMPQKIHLRTSKRQTTYDDVR